MKERRTNVFNAADVVGKLGRGLGGAFRAASFELVAQRNLFRPEDALILCGDPRGGTTWFSEILCRASGSACLWEPLDIAREKTFRRLGFRWRHLIREADPDPEAKAAFDRLFSGGLLTKHICLRTSPSELRRSDRILVKFCRATQLLPWLTRSYEFRRKPVHLLRHPCAVVASQLRYGAWDGVAARFDVREIASDPLMAPHEHILRRVDTVEQRLAAVWCMVNRVALRHPEAARRWITVRYEDLLVSPGDVLARIGGEWNMPLRCEDEAAARKPSATTLDSSPIARGNATGQLDYWRRELRSEQIDGILGIVDEFGMMDDISTSEAGGAALLRSGRK